jgi:hypothetical protein
MGRDHMPRRLPDRYHCFRAGHCYLAAPFACVCIVRNTHLAPAALRDTLRSVIGNEDMRTYHALKILLLLRGVAGLRILGQASGLLRLCAWIGLPYAHQSKFWMACNLPADSPQGPASAGSAARPWGGLRRHRPAPLSGQCSECAGRLRSLGRALAVHASAVAFDSEASGGSPGPSLSSADGGRSGRAARCTRSRAHSLPWLRSPLGLELHGGEGRAPLRSPMRRLQLEPASLPENLGRRRAGSGAGRSPIGGSEETGLTPHGGPVASDGEGRHLPCMVPYTSRFRRT